MPFISRPGSRPEFVEVAVLLVLDERTHYICSYRLTSKNFEEMFLNIAVESMELRPLTLGEILDRTAQVYRFHFLLFVGISIFPTSLLLVIGLVQVGLVKAMSAGSAQLSRGVGLAFGGAFLGGLVYAVLLGVSLAATNRAVSDLYLGQPASIGRAYQQVKPHWFRYIWLMFVAAVYAWAPAFLLVIFAVGGTVLPPSLRGAMGKTTPFVSLLVILLAVPLGVWMTLRYVLAVPASIFEDLRIHASLKRSVLLTRNGRGRIFVVMLLVVAIALVLTFAIQLPLMVLGVLIGKSNSQLPVLALVGSQVGSFIVNALLGPVYGIAITLFYYDERIRKEGFDIEWMMRRAQLGSDPAVPIQTPIIGGHSEGELP